MKKVAIFTSISVETIWLLLYRRIDAEQEWKKTLCIKYYNDYLQSITH